MSPLPVPPWLGGVLGRSGTNASLLFERHFGGYADDWVSKPTPEAKRAFLRGILSLFASPAAHYAPLMERRWQALRARGARSFKLTTQTRLAIGLGLASPLENGLLLDRRTGAPYLPGSSVKGLARATAALVAGGEIETSAPIRSFWAKGDVLTRAFGGDASLTGGLRRGEATFFDAFAEDWPRLEIDVLTPHHQDYYAGKGPPADWDEPVPVEFLTVAAGATFVFHIATRDAEIGSQLETVIRLGVEWLGIGAKTAAGYGVLGEPQMKRDVVPAGPTTWEGVTLELRGSQLRAAAGPRGPVATGSAELLAARDRQALRTGQVVRADVEVVPAEGGRFAIVAVRARRDGGRR